MIKDLLSRQFVLFLLSGGIAAVVNFGSRIFYNQWMDFSIALLVAHLTGMITAFVLAKLFVFKKSKQHIRRSVWIFSLVNLIAVAQTWCVSFILAYLLPWVGIAQFVHEIAHGIGVVVPVFTSYIGHKHWSFR